MDSTVSFTLEPADMKAFLVYWRRHSPASQRLRRVMWTIFVLISLIHAFFRFDDTTLKMLGFFLGIAIFSFTSWLFGQLTRRLVNRHILDPRQQPGLYCEHTLTLTDVALVEVTSINESRHLWSGLHGVVDVPDYIYLFITADLAHVVPKRAFPSPSAANAFASRAKELWATARPA